MRVGKTVEVATREAWRAWLHQHHATHAEVWVVYHRQESGRPSLDYAHSVEEALCYGWIDGLIKKLDHLRYARRFTPRKPGSIWSPANLERYARLAREGLLHQAGKQKAPPPGTEGYVPMAKRTLPMPPELKAELARSARARAGYEKMPPGQQRLYVAWVSAAKQPETRVRRATIARKKLALGKKWAEK